MNNQFLTGLLCIHSGKVRDTYSLPGFPGKRLIVVTNRISTHNVLHLSLIPEKGQVLLALTLFWERYLKRKMGIKTHTVAFGKEIYKYLPRNIDYPDDLHLYAIVAEDIKMFPYEFIYRGRMAGSLWKDFYSQGIDNPYGLILPKGMRLMDEFAQPIFTPTDKSATDEPVLSNTLSINQRGDVRVLCNIYISIRAFARGQGIDIIDGKFEAGLDKNGRRVLADEFGTPDCCRFVDLSSIKIGEEPRWLDKEFVRHEAEVRWQEEDVAKYPLIFSDGTIKETVARYHEVVERLTGMSLRLLQEDLGMF
jgi:phosphoribosylaminoimidazole-succinocarboxamide synthase